MDGNISQSTRVNIVSRVSGPRGSRSADVNLDIFVRGRRFGPVVPLSEVPAVGVTELGERAVVVIYYRASAIFVLGEM